MVLAALRSLAAAQNAREKNTRQALARCAEKYILGALGYERTNESEGLTVLASPSPAVLGR
jgi:hypothetical protein